MHAAVEASIFKVLSIYQTFKQPNSLDGTLFYIMLYILVVIWDTVEHTACTGTFNEKHMEV